MGGHLNYSPPGAQITLLCHCVSGVMWVVKSHFQLSGNTFSTYIGIEMFHSLHKERRSRLDTH